VKDQLDPELYEIFDALQLSGSMDTQDKAVEVFVDCTKYEFSALAQEVQYANCALSLALLKKCFFLPRMGS
jgi:hypothetical protein